MLNPKLKHHKALCGVLNRPQSALWCFDYGYFIQQSEQETVRKHSGHKIYSARNFLKLMSDAKKKQKKHRRHGLSKKVQSASTMIYREEGFREPAFVGVTRLGMEQYLAD